MKVLLIEDVPNIQEIINSKTCIYCSKILSPKINLEFCSSRCKKLYDGEILPDIKVTAVTEKINIEPIVTIPQKEPEKIEETFKETYKKITWPLPEIICPDKSENSAPLISSENDFTVTGPKITCPACMKVQDLKRGQRHCERCDGEIIKKCLFCHKDQVLHSGHKFCVHCGVPWEQKCPNCRKIISSRPEPRYNCNHCGFAMRICRLCFRPYPLNVLKCQNSYCYNQDIFWTEEASGGNDGWENIGGDIFYSNYVSNPPYFTTTEQLWKYETIETRKLLPPLNKSGIVVVASREGDVLFFSEMGDDMKGLSGTADFIHPPLLLNKLNLESEITAYPCIRDNIVYFGLSSGQILTVKLDIWENREFASGLSEIISIAHYKDMILAVNKMGDLIILDIQGSRLFTHYLNLPEDSRFLGMLPLLFNEDKVYYVYNYRITRNESRASILAINLYKEDVRCIVEEQDFINYVSLCNENLFVSLRNEVIIRTLEGERFDSFNLDSSLNVPISLDIKKNRLIYSYGNNIESRKFDGTALSRKFKLNPEKVIKTPPVILDKNFIYGDNSYLYLNDSIRSVTMNGIPSPYLSYSNGKIFLTTETGGVYAFRLKEEN